MLRTKYYFGGAQAFICFGGSLMHGTDFHVHSLFSCTSIHHYTSTCITDHTDHRSHRPMGLLCHHFLKLQNKHRLMLCSVACCGGTNNNHLHLFSIYHTTQRGIFINASSLATLTSLPLYQNQVSLIPFALDSHTKHVTAFHPFSFSQVLVCLV